MLPSAGPLTDLTKPQQIRNKILEMDDASIEADLIRRIGLDEKEAFEELYARYSKPLYSYIYKFLRDRMTAEEVLQDAFVKLWKTAKRYDPKLSRPFSWAVLVTKRLCIDRLRKKKLEVAMEDPFVGQTQQSFDRSDRPPSQQAEIAEGIDNLREMLKKLPDPQRKSLSLALSKGLTQQEISNALDMPLGSVKSAMRRGMARLQQLMTQCYEQ